MKQHDNNKLTERQQRNMQIADDRFELLDTIRDMIDIELERRIVSTEGDHQAQNPPPKRVRNRFFQRILNFLTSLM